MGKKTDRRAYLWAYKQQDNVSRRRVPFNSYHNQHNNNSNLLVICTELETATCVMAAFYALKCRHSKSSEVFALQVTTTNILDYTQYTVSQKKTRKIWSGIAQNCKDRFWWHLARILKILYRGAENAGRENDGREIDGPMWRAWNCRTWKWWTWKYMTWKCRNEMS